MTADPKSNRGRSFPLPSLRSLFKKAIRVPKGRQDRESSGEKEVINSETTWSTDVPLPDAFEPVERTDPMHEEVQDSLLHAIGLAQHDIENRCLSSCSSSTSRRVKAKSTRTVITQTR